MSKTAFIYNTFDACSKCGLTFCQGKYKPMEVEVIGRSKQKRVDVKKINGGENSFLCNVPCVHKENSKDIPQRKEKIGDTMWLTIPQDEERVAEIVVTGWKISNKKVYIGGEPQTALLNGLLHSIPFPRENCDFFSTKEEALQSQETIRLERKAW